MLKGDVVIVGAGPAGTAAAYVLAGEGAKVYLLERGEHPGTKNLFGGVFYTQVLADLIPGFWEEAPLERVVTRRILTLLGTGKQVNLDLSSSDFSTPPYNAVTLLRPKFDAWFAEKASGRGACLLNNTLVEDLLWDKGKVCGVQTNRPQGKIYANVVIAADGANSLLAKKAGLTGKVDPENMSLGLKQVFHLPGEEINRRFNLHPDEGMAREFIGGLPVQGGGFLYTNKNSLSLGTVVQIKSLMEQKVQATEVLEYFCNREEIRDLLVGGVPLEYGAHLIPEGGYNHLPQLSTGGMLLVGDAAGLVLATGVTFEGMNYAMASGIIAAQAVLAAAEKKDFSAAALENYRQLLEKSYVLKNFRNFKSLPAMLANPRLHFIYPELAAGLLEKGFTVGPVPKEKLLAQTRRELQGKVKGKELLRDLAQIWRGLIK